MRKYIFLASSERSGSNFLLDTFYRRVDIDAMPVSHIGRLLCINRMKFGSFESDVEWNSFVSFADEIWRTGVGSHSYPINFSSAYSLPVSKRSIVGIFDYICDALDLSSNIVFVKENLIFEFITPFLFNDRFAGLVYLVRNPIAVLSSSLRSSNHSGDINSFVDHWVNEQLSFIRLCGYLKDFTNVSFIRYEDFISDVDRAVQTFCSLFGLRALLSFKESLYFKSSLSVDNFKNIPVSVTNNRNELAFDYMIEQYGCDAINNLSFQGLDDLFNYSNSSSLDINIYPVSLLKRRLGDISFISSLSQDESSLRSHRESLLKKLRYKDVVLF